MSRFVYFVLFIIITFFNNHTVFSQNQSIDSLKLALKSAKHDTIRCNILAILAESASDEEWPKYNEELLKLAELKLKTTNSATEEYKFYQKNYAISLNNVGYLAKFQGDIPKALNYYSKSLKIHEKINYYNGIASTLINIGLIYQNQGDINKALECFERSLKIYENIGDKYFTAITLNNIGSLYDTPKDITKSLVFYERSLNVFMEINNKEGVSYSLNNIGFVYYILGENLKSLEYFSKSLKIREEINDKSGISNSLNNIGSIYRKQNKYLLAEMAFTKSIKVSKEIGDFENLKTASKNLHDLYKQMGKHKLALEYFELHIQMRDSLNNIETQKATIKQQTQYEYDKKKAVEDEKHAAELKVQDEKAQAEKKRQNIIIASVSIILIIVAFFSILLFNRFKTTQKQKQLIEVKEKETQHQKQIIEEKHKEITDSINYAERIQKSFLATHSHLNSYLTEYFVLFKPKDVVSGDFYWSATLNNGNFALATADSTGHGVPGAIMSLLNITSLEKAIETETSPEAILNLTRKTIIERLKKDGSPEGGKDGMDCSLCVFDFKNKKLFVANANNPVWIIRNVILSESEESQERDTSFSLSMTEKEIIEIKADKMPVGKHDKQDIPFTVKEYDLQKGDVVYTLTDGFPDQFGGEKGKKFMSKNLRELLANNSHLTMNEQQDLLEKTFSDWVGQLEQVDDVTIIGVRIS